MHAHQVNSPDPPSIWKRTAKRMRPRHGMVLILVLIVVMLIALAAYGFAFFMRAEYRATRSFLAQSQARAAATSGLEYALTRLESPRQQRQQQAGPWIGIPLESATATLDDSIPVWRFSIIGPRLQGNAGSLGNSLMTSGSMSSGSSATAGWQDESAKINLLALAAWESDHPGHAEQVLLQLPGLDDATRNELLMLLVGQSTAASGSTSSSSGSSRARDSVADPARLSDPFATPPPAPSSTPSRSAASSSRSSASNSPRSSSATGSSSSRSSRGTRASAPTGTGVPSNDGEPGQGSAVAEGEAVVPDQPRANAGAIENESLRQRLRNLLQDSPDWNGNYRRDPTESATWLVQDESGPSESLRNQLESGLGRAAGGLQGDWRHFVTLDSAERNQSATGAPRIDVNASNLNQLHQQLLAAWPVEWANFVVLFRQYGGSRGGRSPSQSGQVRTVSAGDIELDFNQPGGVQIESLLDLIGKQVRVEQDEEQLLVESPFEVDPSQLQSYLPQLLDQATTDARQRLTGRINILQAPLEVLLAIPTLESATAEQIVQQRVELQAAEDQPVTIGWLASSEIVELNRLRELEPYITTGGDVKRAQVVGYRDDFDPLCRIDAILDGTQSPPTIVYYRELQQYGRGFRAADLDALAPPSNGMTP